MLRKSLSLAALAFANAHLAVVFAAPPDLIEPNENLRVSGIPPIDRALAERVGRYTEMRSASFASWHPTEARMLISTRFGNTNQIHEVRRPLGARTQLTFSPERVTSAQFPPAGAADFFVFTRDRGGDEFAQLYRYDLVSGREVLLSDGGRSQNSLGPWSRDGVWLAYASTRRNGRDRDLWVIDPRRPETNRLVAAFEGGGWRPVAWGADRRSLIVGEYRSVNQSFLWLVDAETGARRLLTPEPGDEPVVWAGGEPTADGRGLWVITDRGSEFRRLGILDLESGSFEPVVADLGGDIASVEVSPDGGTVAFTTNELGVSRLYLLDAATRARRELQTPGVGIVGQLEWHPSGQRLAFGYTSSNDPGDVWVWGRADGRLVRWTESETGGIPAASLPTAELIRWKSFDGLEISGFISRPPARFSGPRPVIISIHGGPEGQARPSFLGQNAFWVNELGIAYITPNVRGSTGFGKTFVKLDNGLKREDSVRDISALLDWIATQPDLDTKRVMVTGGSYGGYMTMAVAVAENERIRCSLQVVGIANFVSFLERTEAYRRDLRRVEYGDEREPEMRAFLEKISPLRRAAEIKKPFFAVQGANDPRVPLFEAEQIIAAVQGNGIPVWSLIAADEGHGFAKKDNRDFQFYATVSFVEQFLLGNGTAPAVAAASAR